MNRFILTAFAAGALFVGCGDDDETVPPVDGGSDAGDSPTCADYCMTVTTNCTGDNAQYTDMAACMTYCETNGGWEAGTLADTSGNTIGCRLYHAGAPAVSDAVVHCPHAGPSGGNTCGTWCDNYCQLALDNCMGGNSIWPDMAACAAACEGFDVTGTPGATSGDTVQCRIYHLGVAGTDPASATIHCPHGTVEGGGPTVCGSTVTGFDFRTEAASMFVRVDRMGMPAVSTALIPTDRKNLYNDSNPSAESNPGESTFVPDIVGQLQAIHGILYDDLVGAGLVPCSTPVPAAPHNVDQCVAQGAPLIIPDVLHLDTATDAGFPNGRLYQDQVIDITLAVILLNITPPSTQTARTLADIPLNPGANEQALPDRTMPGAFPWLNGPYEM